MEGRMSKHLQISPERAKVWTEKSTKYRYNHRYSQQQPQNNSVPVVYYLCRNRQLEHPHFMEVPLSSPDGLYLRDVIERLGVLRGRGMASMYSWSCKRSYRNCLVWHDLCADDLILPAQGNEYVLKGSELFEESSSARFSQDGTITLLNQKALPEPPSSRSQEESSSSSSLNGRTTKSSQDDDLSPPAQQHCSSAMSPESSMGKNSPWNGSLSLTKYKVSKSYGLSDASTQTEENAGRISGGRETCTRGVSTDDGSLESKCNENGQKLLPEKESLKICRDFVSQPASSSNTSSRRVNTLESLIKAEAMKLNSFQILEEEEFRMPTSGKLTASNLIMQLISCGSISVKDHSFGLIPTYKPRFSSSKFTSPLYSTPSMLGELDCLANNPCNTNVKLRNKEYFSGSFVEMNMLKEGTRTLKRSSSYNADRSTTQNDANKDTKATGSESGSIKASLGTQTQSESMRFPLSEGPRTLSDTTESSRPIAPCTSDGGSKRNTKPLVGRKQSVKVDSCKNEKENAFFKIEERLSSGARVIIQSKASSDEEDC